MVTPPAWSGAAMTSERLSRKQQARRRMVGLGWVRQNDEGSRAGVTAALPRTG